MAEIKAVSSISMTVDVHLKLTEGEAKALEAICGYGPDLFVEWFYKTHGKHYLQPHEKAMRSLFATVKQNLPGEIRKIDKLREAIKKNL